jgi:hypothetical protein
MKSRSFIGTIGSGMAVVVAAGMLAALPANAGSGLIKITHSDTPYRGPSQPASSTVAKVQATGSQAAPAEIQVAVMAKSPVQPASRRGVFIRR